MKTIKVYGIIFLMVMGLILLALPPKDAAAGINFVTILVVDDTGQRCVFDFNEFDESSRGTDAHDELTAGMEAAAMNSELTFLSIAPNIIQIMDPNEPCAQFCVQLLDQEIRGPR